MSNHYGLCIGGPLDGQMLQHYDTAYCAPERSPRTPLPNPAAYVGQQTAAMRIVTYLHDWIEVDTDQEPIYFWRDSRMTRHDAFMQVFSNYPRGNFHLKGGSYNGELSIR